MQILGDFRHGALSAFLLFLSVHVQDSSGGWLDKVGGEVGRLSEQVAAEARRVGPMIMGEFQRVSPNIGVEFRRVGEQNIVNVVRPQAENVGAEEISWFAGGSSTELQELTTRGNLNHHEEFVIRIAPPAKEATACSPIVESSLDIDCDFEGESVNCTEPMAKGTVAHMKCKDAYVFLEYPGYNSVTCNETFSWSEPIIKCVPDCGKRNSGGGQQLVANGTEVAVGEFSWHVGVYRLNSSKLYGEICGATLVTPSLIMSVAHCFWDTRGGKVLDTAPYKLAAGKYHRDWYVEDSETQKRDVLEFFVHQRFKGHKLNLAYDIAMIKTTEPFVLTWAINVICFDWQLDLEDEHLSRGNNGMVAGWGITELNKPSPILKWVSLPFVPYIQCGNVVEADFQKYLTQDKLCGGWLNRGTSICPGDSGGGYVFPQMTRHGQRYFLQGIASSGHTSRVTGVICQSQQLAIFTQISTYLVWVENIVFNKTKKFETGD